MADLGSEGFARGDSWWSPNNNGVFGSMEGAGGLGGHGTAWSYPFSISPRTWDVLFFPPFSFSFSFFKGFLINFLFQWWDNEF